MIEMNSNISDVITNVTAALNEIENQDQVMRAVAQTLLTEVHDRIHDRGQDSKEAQIGEYSNSYMAVRTGNYQNADRTKKGKIKNAGTYTDSVIRLDKKTGVFTGTEKVGTKRPTYNRTNDKKVILSLTRQMENDFSVIATANGYGLGYHNEENYKKSQYAEANYNKKIFDLTEKEEQLAFTVAETEVNRLLNG